MEEFYNISEKEKENVLRSCFKSGDKLKLIAFPVKKKKQIIVLKEIARKFNASYKYNEKEINEIIKDICDDYVSIRRHLIEYGFLERANDCSEYWLKE
ncbi:MAG: DUF2087 domain-containing protein [Clostridium sp.]|uniref:DUF2087 domain-containing protein n=1 Tax=Clostridium sp. TaxID=1506 RepID=UPI0030459653